MNVQERVNAANKRHKAPEESSRGVLGRALAALGEGDAPEDAVIPRHDPMCIKRLKGLLCSLILRA